MNMTQTFAIFLLTAFASAGAQAIPNTTGGSGLPVSSDLHYSLRYSQAVSLYGNNALDEGNQDSSIASANLDYIHAEGRLPFQLHYGGGYMWSISGPSLGSGVFQSLSVSQGLVQGRWKALVSDSVSYTPEAPLAGVSGIPGSGDPIGTAGANPSSSQSILTLNTRTLSNSANVEFGYQLTYSTTLDLGGGAQLLRYPDGNGLDSDGERGSVGITRRIDPLNSISGLYTFSRFSYGASPYADGTPASFDTNSVSVDYSRSWSRNLRTDLSVGPQWISGSDSELAPPTTTVMVNAVADYEFRPESVYVNYSRGISGGAGYLPGGTFDAVTGGLSRKFGRELTIGVTGTYSRTAALESAGGGSDARFGEAQATRRLGQHLNFFASYTAIDQSSGLQPQANILNQFYQVVSFGVGYASGESRLRQ
jgi:hypothetical protein